MPDADLDAAAAAVDLARSVVDGAAATWPGSGPDGVDAHQVVAYDLAHAAAAVRTARAALDYGSQGRRRGPPSPAPSWPTRSGRHGRRSSAARRRGGSTPGALDAGLPFVGRLPRPGVPGRRWPASRDPGTSTATSRWCSDTFRRFAEDRIRPVAEHIHRTNTDIPEEIITGLAEMGAFGLSVPEEYGGFAGRRRERLPGHGGRHRGAVPGLARRRRLADHPARDPDPGPGQGRHRGAEAAVAAAAGQRRGHGGGGGDRARLRLRRGRPQGDAPRRRRRLGRSTGSRRGARSRRAPTC